MAALGHSQAETVALGHQHGCSKVESPLTLAVAPQFLTVPIDNGSARDSTCVGQPEAPICFCRSDVRCSTASCLHDFSGGSRLSVQARSASLGTGYPTFLTVPNDTVAVLRWLNACK